MQQVLGYSTICRNAFEHFFNSYHLDFHLSNVSLFMAKYLINTNVNNY